jgi:hypothetical protein
MYNILLTADRIHFTVVPSLVPVQSVLRHDMFTIYPTWIVARTNTSADGRSHPDESSSVVSCGFIGKTNELLQCLFAGTCSFTSNALNVATYTNLKDWRQNVDQYVFAEIHLYELFTFFGMGTRVWNLCKCCRFTLYTTATERVCLQWAARLVCQWLSYRLIRHKVTVFVVKRSRGNMLPVVMSVLQLRTFMNKTCSSTCSLDSWHEL